jgi:beta-glucosidase
MMLIETFRRATVFGVLPAVLLATVLAASCSDSRESAPADSSAEGGDVASPPAESPWPRIAPAPLDPEVEVFVADLLSRMTLEEKVGQVIQGELRSVTPEDIRRYHLGSVLNGGGSTPDNDKRASLTDWVAAADAFYDASMDTSDGKLAIPVLWGSDAVHGHSNVYGATIFPHNIGLGAANDADLIREIGSATAIEMLTTGLDWTFAPTLAVVRDDRWGRTYEGYSEDPRIVAEYAKAIIEGLQGVPGTAEYLGEDKILATAKHYLGDGGTDGGRDQGNNIHPEEELVRIHNAGYPPAIEAGVRSIMASFNSWHGKKLHGHRHLLTTALKDRMGFNGFVVGDWNGHGQVDGCTNDNCAASFKAGLDMFMVPEDFRALHGNLMSQVQDGTIAEERLDDAVTRILRVKSQAGLFEAGRPSSRTHSGRQENLGSAPHRGLARRAVRQSLVLLKNNGSLLPLAPSARVLVAGDGADNIGKQTGGWTLTWQGTGNTNEDFPGATSIYAGIRDVVEAAGGAVELDVEGNYTERPDAAVVVFGEDPYAEFQGDAPNVMYENDNGSDLALLRALKADGIPVVAVFISGRPMWVNPHLNASDAFVAAWLPGSEGAGIADLLFRQADGGTPYDFTGRLSYSWPRAANQTALNVGDADYDPLFAYGYGLTFAESTEIPVLSEESGLSDADAGASGTWFTSGRPLTGFSAMIGSDHDDLEVVQGLEMASDQLSPSITMADREVQGDSSLLRWRPDVPGYFVLRADGRPLDLQRESNGHLSLSLLLKTVQAPSQPVLAAMRDASGHTAQIDVTPLLDVEDGWQDYRLSLRCFEERGVNMEEIAVPLELYTTDEAQLVLAEVRLATAAEGDAFCPAL